MAIDSYADVEGRCKKKVKNNDKALENICIQTS